MIQEKTIEMLDNSKIELMKTKRKQIKELKSNLVILQSGNGGIISERMDDAAFESRFANARLDEILERSIEYHKIYK